MAEALVYAEPSAAAHERLIREAFAPAAPEARVRALAARTLAWTAVRPQPRIGTVAKRLREAARGLLRRREVRLPAVPIVPVMRTWAGLEDLPRLTTVHDLAAWLRVDVPYLQWMADLGDRNRRQKAGALRHYSTRLFVKRSGGVRLVEAPKQHLRHVQRQILREILDRVPVHEAVHGFRKGRSIRSFAEPHGHREVVLRMDLKEFFPSISGARVQALFRTLGYPERVADWLGALCTTTTPDEVWEGLPVEERAAMRVLYRRPHLPQGAPTSPAIANLCARRMDRRLAGLARAAGAAYTRYADDLVFSGDAAFARGGFAVQVASIAALEGFAVQHRKTRVMRGGVRQHLAGLTVNAGPNVSRRELDRLKAVLTNCVRFGAASQNREGREDFRAHLEGKVSFVAMVRPGRAERLRGLLDRVVWEGDLRG